LNYLLVTFLVPFMFIPMFENTVWPFPWLIVTIEYLFVRLWLAF
jgi:hypothetical protein